MPFVRRVLLILVSLFALQAFGLTPGVEKLVEYETRYNAAASRSSAPVAMPHFEIPLEFVTTDIADRFSADSRKHFIFEKDGRKYVRWVLNPEDTTWFLEVQKHFENLGVRLEVKNDYFIGYQTASRSYIIEDRNHKIQISVKSSTDHAGGNWSDKKLPVSEAIDSRLNADYLYELQKRLGFQHVVIMDEPMSFRIPGIDQGVVFRDLGDLNGRSDFIYVPGFSVLHDKLGREIALANGSDNPYRFWSEHYIMAAARAMGELAARTGLQFDSPHSQNFLVELDQNLKPTGRIVIRDLADFAIDRTFIEAAHPNAKEYLSKFQQRKNILENISANFGPMHGNHYPSWLGDPSYYAWKDFYYFHFEKTFSEVSGIDRELFTRKGTISTDRYFMNWYQIGEGTLTETFWKNMRAYRNPKGLLNCSSIYEY